MAISQAAIVRNLAAANGYTVDTSRELIALGVINIFGPCVGGYLTMSSISSSKILSMAGSRSQLAGVFAALMVVMALYLLIGVFAYTPIASLAGLVIYSMAISLPQPKAIWRDLRFSPVHTLIWFVSLIMGLLYSLEWALYIGTILTWLVKFCKPIHGNKLDVLCPGVFTYRLPRDLSHFNRRKHLSFVSTYLKENASGFRALILDFEELQDPDLESCLGLADLQRELPDNTRVHCAGMHSIWGIRSLVDAGFDSDKFHEGLQDAVDAVTKSG